MLMLAEEIHLYLLKIPLLSFLPNATASRENVCVLDKYPAAELSIQC